MKRLTSYAYYINIKNKTKQNLHTQEWLAYEGKIHNPVPVTLAPDKNSHVMESCEIIYNYLLKCVSKHC
jgi:hypothetical protein